MGKELLEEKIEPIKANKMLTEVETMEVDMFAMSPQSPEAIEKFGLYLWGSEAKNYYEAKKQAGSFVQNTELENSKRMAA